MSAMLFDASIVPTFWQWLWLLVAAAAALVAVVTTPWRLLLAVPMRQHLVFGSAVFLSAIWFLTAISLTAPVTIHLLALATLVLMLGPGLAYLSGLVALLMMVLLQGLEWRVLGVNAVCGVLTPVLSTYAVLVLSRRIKVAQQFVFILGAGDLSPRYRTMTRMRFPVSLPKRKSHHEEETFYRRTNHWRYQRA